MKSRRSARNKFLLLPVILMACATPHGGEEPVNAVFEVRQMLHQRAQALSRGDSAGYLKPLSAGARAAEKSIAVGARAVPLSSARLIFTPAQSASLNATSFSEVPTQLAYRYKGLPSDNVFRFNLLYDVKKRSGSWVVTESKIDSSKAPPPIWATGPVRTQSSPHFLALHRPGVERVPEALNLAEEARTNLLPKLKLPPDPKNLLLLARDHSEFRMLAGEELDEGVLALAAFQSHDGGLPNRHMLINLQAVLGEPRRVVRGHTGDLPAKSVFQHELGHLALLRYGGQLTPGWVAEGAAMYLSGERRTEQWAVMAHLGLLDRDLSASLVDPSEPGQGALAGELYPYANAVVLYLVETFGAERFWTFYRTFKRLDPDVSSLEEAQAVATQKLLRDVYRLDARSLDQSVREYMKKQLLNP